MKDKFGNEFDPEIHETDLHGKPIYTKSGKFRGRAGRKRGSKKENWESTAIAEREAQIEAVPVPTQTIHDQLFKAAKQYKFNGNGIDALRAIADNVVDMAVNPDKTFNPTDQKWAIEQVWDRLYGKASQKSESEKRITVEIVKDFSEALPEPRRAIEGELSNEIDTDLAEVMEELR